MVVTGLDVNGALDQHSAFWAQLQATLNFLPAHAWYALPNGALTFLNARIADYLGLPKDHPQRFGTDTGADWDSNLAFLHPDDRANLDSSSRWFHRFQQDTSPLRVLMNSRSFS